jgi:hypothetical protein
MEPSSAEKIIWPPVHLETILVPTDLRPDSKVALSFAVALAQKFEANLVLLHVFAEPYSSDTEIGAGAGRLTGCNERRRRARGCPFGRALAWSVF